MAAPASVGQWGMWQDVACDAAAGEMDAPVQHLQSTIQLLVSVKKPEGELIFSFFYQVSQHNVLTVHPDLCGGQRRVYQNDYFGFRSW